MKRTILRCAAGLLIAAALLPTALAAEPFPAVTEVQVCYPTSVTRSEDGTEIRKVYDLSPEQDPAGIPRSDFEQDGFHYTLTDLLQQELPECESRPHTETVSLESKSKDMESVLALLPQEKEFVTEDGLSGTLSLQLDTVQVEAAGYGSSTREVSATRSYPNLASQDTASIPKSIEEDGRNLTLNRVRYVAIFEGEPLEPAVPMEESGDGLAQFNWAAILLPLGVVFAVGGVIGACLFVKRRRENKEDSE